VQLEGVREGKPLRVRAGRVIDASGPRGFIHRTLGIAEAEFADYPATCAAYSHFTGVARWDEIFPYKDAPYPPDDAAVHHLFDGGWMWVLRFDNGLTSAGVVLDDPPPAGACEPEAMWARTLGRFPSLAVQFAAARPALPMRAIPRMAYRTSRCVGEGWAMLPMAAGFVDPLFSTGFALSLLGIERLAGVVELGSGPGLWEAYGGEVLADLDATASLIGAAHRVLGDPEGFRAVAMGYFAAVSFAETWRRLGKTPPSAFLLRDDPRFAEVRACWADAGRIPGGELHERVRRAVEPVNITGLCDAGKRNWYPVDARDLLDNAHRLGASAEEIAAMLRRAGFTA
jgi:FADH2 O2-dependent halogenase